MNVRERVLSLVQKDKALWRDIPNFPGYQVSKEGQVRSRNGKICKNWYLLRQFSRKGYQTVCLKKMGNSGQINKFVHSLILNAFVGPKPSKKYNASHLDGNPLNNSLSNLRWETYSENCLRKEDHGTDNKGEKHNLAKLTEGDVFEIRDLYERGFSYGSISNRFPISRDHVGNIVRRKSWSHI